MQVERKIEVDLTEKEIIDLANEASLLQSDYFKKEYEFSEYKKNQKRKILDEATMAQEIDRSYSKSMEGRVYKWFDAEKHAKDTIDYNKNYPIIISCDWGIGDPTAVIIAQYYGGILHIIGNIERKDDDLKNMAIELLRKIERGKKDITLLCQI